MTTPSIEERLARLEGSYEQINLRLGRLEEEMSALRSEMNALATGLRAEMSTLGSEMNARMDRVFFYMLALMGGIMASIIATILARLL